MIRELPLTTDAQQELDYYRSQGAARLQLGDANATAVVQQVDAFIDNWQLQSAQPNPQQALDLSLQLGALWGDQVAKQFGWEWICFEENGTKTYGVALPDRSLVLKPFNFTKACLDNPKLDCTIMLSFNMLLAGSIPKMPARGFEDLMGGVHRIVPKR